MQYWARGPCVSRRHWIFLQVIDLGLSGTDVILPTWTTDLRLNCMSETIMRNNSPLMKLFPDRVITFPAPCHNSICISAKLVHLLIGKRIISRISLALPAPTLQWHKTSLAIASLQASKKTWPCLSSYDIWYTIIIAVYYRWGKMPTMLFLCAYLRIFQ